MKFRHVFVALLLTSFSCPFITTGQQSEIERLKHAKAQVHIILTDGGSRDVGEGHIVSFKNRTSGKDFAGDFRENGAASIPYGSYDLEVRKTGWFPARRSVDVYSPDIWVIVGLRVGEELPEFPAARFTLNGTVKKFGAELDPVYVRLVGLYSTYTADARVSLTLESRTFQFAGIIPDGRFVLLFFNGKGLLCAVPLVIPNDRNVEVDLGGGCHP